MEEDWSQVEYDDDFDADDSGSDGKDTGDENYY